MCVCVCVCVHNTCSLPTHQLMDAYISVIEMTEDKVTRCVCVCVCVCVHNTCSLPIHPLMNMYIFVIERKGGQGHCVLCVCVCVCVCVHSTLSLPIHPFMDAYTLLLRGPEDKVTVHHWAAESPMGNTCPSAGLLLTSPVLQADQRIPPRRRAQEQKRSEFPGLSWGFHSCHLPNLWVSWTSLPAAFPASA